MLSVIGSQYLADIGFSEKEASKVHIGDQFH
jgi:hypothetical protein